MLFFILLSAMMMQASMASEPLPTLTSYSEVISPDLSQGDMFDGTRAQISRLVNDLNNNGNRGQQLLTEVSDSIVVARNNLNLDLGNITAGIWTAIQNIIGGFLDSTIVLPEVLWTCVENQISQAGVIVNDTLSEGFECLNNGVNSALGLLNNGVTLIGTAYTIAAKIASDTINCGISNLLNFAQVGICLNKILQEQQAPVNNLIGEISTLLSTAATYVISIPITIGVCLAATGSNAAIKSAALIADVVACGANGVIEVIIQG